MDIGRRIFFDGTTGEVLAESGEMSGMGVVERSTPTGIGYIDLPFGQDADKFSSCYGYHVDVATKTVVFNTVPPQATLQQAQDIKMQQINSVYDKALAAGVTSTASGNSVTYAYDPASQQKYLKLIIAVTSGMQTYPVVITDINGNSVSHTQEQLSQLFKDLTAFEWEQEAKRQTLYAQVKAATTVNEIDIISW